MKVFGPGMIKPGKRIIFAIKISLIWTLTLREVFTGKESTHTNAHTNKHTHTPHTYKYTTVTKVVYTVKLKRVVFLQWLPQGSEDNQWHTVTALVNIKHCFIFSQNYNIRNEKNKTFLSVVLKFPLQQWKQQNHK